MDYTVGSVADLITGSNTPNKQKIVRKKLQKKNSPKSESVFFEDKNGKPEQKKTGKGPKTGQKRKIQNNQEKSPIVEKKSKNTENAERRIIKQEKPEKPKEDPEVTARTIYVGNLPINVDIDKLKTFFEKYGSVETLRLRGAPVADPKIPKKVAIIKKEFHPERKSILAFVRFEQREDAVKALEANGTVFQDHHLCVNLSNSDKHDENKAIFIGNLSFAAEEEDLWQLFESCGTISSVRIVRHKMSGMGKGFGYVNFENADSVPLALEMQNIKLKDRELRISVCNIKASKKNKNNNKTKKISKPGKPKKFVKKEKETDEIKAKTEVKNADFQDAKFATKNKKKFNKGLKQKKIIKQIAPK